MARTLFGTDGIRGQANTEPMTATTALNVAMATGQVLKRGSHRNKVIIGKDTRLSGYMIEPAMVAGFVAMGMDVFLVGPLPTPAIAMLTRSMRCDLGVMISASHNPYSDNGIKLFGADGYKLDDKTESAIEEICTNGLNSGDLASADNLGRAQRIDDAMGRYIEYAKNTFPRGLRLDGLKIVVDCANGAAYKVAPRVLWELGAEVITLATTPDGTNINKNCGATDIAALQETVIRNGADIGIALDGDADRLILCDENGLLVDGDQIMAVIAASWKAQGRLRGNKVVATVMSNLGLERFLHDQGLALIRTAVGDRAVVEQMRKNDANLGGEQSGHIILNDYSTTGDGLVAALQVLAVLQQEQKPASALCRPFTPVPQILKSLRYTNPGLLENETFIQNQHRAQERLSNVGRLLVRKSGTEPVIRIMAEGDDAKLVETIVDDLCAMVKQLDTPA